MKNIYLWILISMGSTVQAQTKKDAPTFPIEGKYVAESSIKENCEIKIYIKKSTEGYSYRLITEEKDKEGKLTIEKPETADESFPFVLEGIEWSAYEGDISDDLERDQQNSDILELPEGIRGVLKPDGITIQNYGNAMNYYVQLQECGAKYIELKKE